jgi:hypothetical protein
VKNQSIELATSVSRAFIDNKGDGLLGMSFGSNNSVRPEPVATPVENMILQDDIPPEAELFTSWMGNKLEVSFFTFGYIDEKALQGQQPTYTPLDNSQGSWLFESSIASINGKQYDRSGNKAIADTGTTLCLLGDSLCERIYSAIPGARKSSAQQGWVFPTPADLNSLPKIALSVGNAIFLIKPTDFAFQGNSRFGCTQRDLPPSTKPEVPSAHPEKLLELAPLPADGSPPPRPKRQKTFDILRSCCFGTSRAGSSRYE